MLNNLFKREERALSYQSLFAAGADFDQRTYAGTVVNQETALKIGTVYACVRLYADTISTLPIDVYTRTNGERLPFRPKPLWVVQPAPNVTPQEHFAEVLISLLVDGNAFVRKYRSNTGAIVSLGVLDPRKVDVQQDANGDLVYIYNDRNRYGVDDVLHIKEMPQAGKLRGASRIEQNKDTLGLASALTEFSARFFGQGAVTSGIIETPATLNAEQAAGIKQVFENSHKGLAKSHRVGVLGGGAKYQKTGVDPEQAQFLESRQFSVTEICRLFRVPPHMVQVTDPGAMSYASVEQNAIQFAQYSLRPYISKLESAYSTMLPGEAFLKFNLDGLLRGDLATRYGAYSVATQAGFLSTNDIHRLEDMPPVDGGDVYRVPLANVDLQAAGIVEQQKRIDMLTKLVTLGFDPEASAAEVGLAPIKHTGLPSVQLQNPSQIDPNNPASIYPS